jgi:hypothetical protein
VSDAPSGFLNSKHLGVASLRHNGRVRPGLRPTKAVRSHLGHRHRLRDALGGVADSSPICAMLIGAHTDCKEDIYLCPASLYLQVTSLLLMSASSLNILDGLKPT